MTDESYPITFTTDYINYESFSYNPSSSATLCGSNTDSMYFFRVFLIVLYNFVFIIGFIGNGLVVCVLLKHHKKSTLTDICLFNLALSDLLFLLTLPLYSHYVMVQRWNLGAFLCRLSSGVHSTGYFSSIFFMVVMTLDRYLAIIHSHKVASYRTMRAGLTLSAVVWALSLGVSLPFFIFTNVTGQAEAPACSYNPDGPWRHYQLFSNMVLGLAVPLLAMVLCYSRIIPVLMRMKCAKKHRAVKLIMVIVGVFFLLWGPYNISLLLEFLCPEAGCDFLKNLQYAIIVTETLAYTHCCLNPIIYAFVGQRFTKNAMQLLKSCKEPGHCLLSRNSESFSRRSSIMSRSSDATLVM